MPTTSSAASGGEPVVIVNALRKTYPGSVVALDGVDLRIERGSITALLGENGSGKSTLLELVAGLARPTGGELAVFGEPARSSATLRRRIGFASQAVSLDPEMTGSETLSLFATLYGVRAAAHERGQLLSDFELTDFIARRVGSYSGGMRQRLHLALALQHRPELVLLDEPTSALDPAGRLWFWQRIEGERSRGSTIVVVTHDLNEAQRHCDRVAILQEGRLLASDTPARIVAEHGRFELEVEIADGEKLPESLAALDGVERVAFRGGRAAIDLGRREMSAALETRDRILALLAEQRLVAFGFRLRTPDLASAYFNLTGRIPIQGGQGEKRGRAERRARMAAP